MSEEEILKECTELAENEHHELGDCWDEEYSSSAIFGLIMLYKQTKKSEEVLANKLQEVNIELDKYKRLVEMNLKDFEELNNIKEIEKSHKEENGKLRVELEQEKEKNNNLIKQLQEQNTQIQDISRQLRQEKEKNKEYENELDKTTYLLSRCNKRLENIARELTAEIKIGYDYTEIMQEIKSIKENECNATKCQMIKENYIRKDKIKEKIEETNSEKLNYSEDEYYLKNEVKGYAIDKLKELLEEK